VVVHIVVIGGIVDHHW